jgi:hypothetical protein
MMKTVMRLLEKHDGLQALAKKNVVPEQEEDADEEQAENSLRECLRCSPGEESKFLLLAFFKFHVYPFWVVNWG